MKLHHLRYVIAAADFGSLRAASRHLGIAQPAFSRSIRQIEHELGAPLFERHARGVKPTAIGAALVRRARSIQGELRRTTEEIEAFKDVSAGRVFAAMSSACSPLLSPAVVAFLDRYPDGQLEVAEAGFQDVRSEILSGQIDFYVGPVDPRISGSQFHVEDLCDVQFVVAARQGHPLATARSWSALAEAQWIRPTLSIWDTEADFIALFLNLGLPSPIIAMDTHSALVAQISLANTDLLTILPAPWIETPLAMDALTALRLDEPLAPVPLSIVRRKDAPLTPMAMHLCHTMRKTGLSYADQRHEALTT